MKGDKQRRNVDILVHIVERPCSKLIGQTPNVHYFVRCGVYFITSLSGEPI